MPRSEDITGKSLAESTLKKIAEKLRREMEDPTEKLPKEIQKALDKLVSERARSSGNSD